MSLIFPNIVIEKFCFLARYIKIKVNKKDFFIIENFRIEYDLQFCKMHMSKCASYKITNGILFRNLNANCRSLRAHSEKLHAGTNRRTKTRL